MDFSYSPEQDALRESVARIFAARVTDGYWKQRRSAPAPYDEELWATLAGAGLLGIAIDEQYGGSGLGMLELAILLEEQGHCLAPLPLLATLVLGALPLASFAREATRGRILPAVADGRCVLTAALHEAAQTDLLRPGARARQSGDAWLLSGEKLAVPSGGEAAYILVPAMTPGGVRVFLLDPTVNGCRRVANPTSSGEPQVALTLESATSLEMLGDGEGAAEVLPAMIEWAGAGVAALQLGCAEEALRRTALYVSERRQFDRPVGSFQAVQQRAANAYIDVAAMRASLLKAAWMIHEKMPASAEAAVAYWWACRGADRVVHAAQHLHGGAGADIDYPIHRYFLWARQVSLTLGGAAPGLERLGREIASGRAAALT